MSQIRVFEKISDWLELRRSEVFQGKSLGFVPTMGALHAGHLKLMENSLQENTYTVVSIFVNPLQFGPKEDFSKYPRPFEKDLELCRNIGVTIVFAPEAKDFYTEDHSTYCEVEGLDRYLCGAARPGHFKGVCTVVLKLFNLIQPHRAYFGQKDIQQALILKKMVEDLSLDLEMKIIPTVREVSGLALSSRNLYLSEEEKIRATSLYRSLQLAEQAYAKGERQVAKIKAMMQTEILASNPTRIDYVEMVSQRTLAPIEKIEGPIAIAVAVFYGNTRLIDNILLG